MQKEKEENDEAGHEEYRRQPGGGETRLEEGEALCHQPSYGIAARIEPRLADRGLAGGEQPLGGEDVVEFVVMRCPLDIDGVKQQAGEAEQNR